MDIRERFRAALDKSKPVEEVKEDQPYDQRDYVRSQRRQRRWEEGQRRKMNKRRRKAARVNFTKRETALAWEKVFNGETNATPALRKNVERAIEREFQDMQDRKAATAQERAARKVQAEKLQELS